MSGAVAAVGVFGLPPLVGVKGSVALALDSSPLDPDARRDRAYELRVDAALEERSVPIPAHPSNGDEERYGNKLGNFTKGLPHDPVTADVDLAAYSAMSAALTSGAPADFERIPLGCPDPARQVKLVNPQAGLAFDLEGTDSHQLSMPPAPAFASAEEAGEIVENYWMALLRDVPFTDYETSTLVCDAAEDLDALSDFKGPRDTNGRVTPRTLFRGGFPGSLEGPYLSQFLLLPAPFGASEIAQKIRTSAAGVDYLTRYDAWLAVQNGCSVPGAELASERRYIVTGRDLGDWVHVDVGYQAYLTAFLVLMALGVPYSPQNPYRHSATQVGFGTFGTPFAATLLAEVTTRALKAQWYEKWFVHRRLRPEEFAGRVHLALTRGIPYPIHPDVFGSNALDQIAARCVDQGDDKSYLLPLAYPEGCPLHPAYASGHATMAGACVTILKALFDESFVIPSPVVPDRSGATLLPYAGSLTVGGELDKLATNIAIARNIAGVHWRSDATEGIRLGEKLAISVLRDQKPTFNEDFEGFRFTSFDGLPVVV